MSDRKLAAAFSLAAVLAAGAVSAQGAKPAAASGIEAVTLPNADSPLVAVHLMFNAGSIYDPAGKEGLAALTAAMLSQAGTQTRPYSVVLEALYPIAASISATPDREVTVFATTVHRETLAEYTKLLTESVLKPGFSEDDFSRNREQLIAALTTGLRSGSDEMLGLEAIQDELFVKHPYGHPPAGTVQGLKSITLDDVKRFYKEHYTQAGLRIGVAGGYPQGYVEGLRSAFSALPAGKKGPAPLPPLPKVEGRNFTVIDKQTGAVGINIGVPLPINRSHPDFIPLLVANSYLGEHRTYYGRLMQQLRGKRGLNYGDYSYIEYWPNPPFTDNPAPGVPRRQQYFSIWIRPVMPADTHFALRAALYEWQKLYDEGISKEDFELSRSFLQNHVNLWVQTLSDRLGFHMDSQFYGMPYYIGELDARLKTVTVDDVNRVVKKYLSPASFDAVVITPDAQAFKDQLQKETPSPKTYPSEVEKETQEADKAIVPLKVKPTSVTIVPVQDVFEK